ncbi:MAG: class I SAM-dependent methyltransferase [Halobacteriales archaeon]
MNDVGHHTYPVERAGELEDVSRYRYLSRDELLEVLEPSDDDVALELGSGTGFYTRDVAGYVDVLVALDVQRGMHRVFREHGMPASVEPLVASVDRLPLRDSSVDLAYSTMTFHEVDDPRSHAEVRRVVRPGGRVVAVDWSAEGEGASGPPLGERASAAGAADALRDAGFSVDVVRERLETYVVVARE